MSTTPDAIQAFAAAEGAVLDSLVAALNSITTGVKALDDLITQLQNSAGQISPADQALLDQIQAKSNALVAQANAINTTPPGTVIPPGPPPGP